VFVSEVEWCGHVAVLRYIDAFDQNQVMLLGVTHVVIGVLVTRAMCVVN